MIWDYPFRKPPDRRGTRFGWARVLWSSLIIASMLDPISRCLFFHCSCFAVGTRHCLGSLVGFQEQSTSICHLWSFHNPRAGKRLWSGWDRGCPGRSWSPRRESVSHLFQRQEGSTATDLVECQGQLSRLADFYHWTWSLDPDTEAWCDIDLRI